jgi:hypothetical protein
MDQEDRNLRTSGGAQVAESGRLRREQGNRYGSVEGLSDEELADPDELERMAYREEYGPILQLPVTERRHPFYGSIDEDGRVDFGAFGTVDFDRYRGEFDKVRYKVDKLKEQLKDLVIVLTILGERIPGRAKYKVLKYVRMGVLDIADIEDNEMYFFAEMYLRTVRLRQEIGRLQEVRRQKGLRQMTAWAVTPEG